VCFASGRGSNVEALIRSIGALHIPARIVLVISNNSGAGALKIARNADIPTLHISEKQYESHERFTQALLDALSAVHTDLIVLAGYMKKLPSEICRKYPGRILNIHPALLPAFGGKGMYGLYVHEAVIASGAQVSGATVHIVNDEYDRGKIIMQENVPVLHDDTPETLAARVLDAEHRILPRAVADIVEQIQKDSHKKLVHE